MKTRIVVAAGVTLAVCLVAADARAQTGIVTGKVLDENAKGVPEASVTLEYLGRLAGQAYAGPSRGGNREVQTDTDDALEGLGGIVGQDNAASGKDAERNYQTETDDKGQYSLIVSPGRYQVTTSREGYQTAILEHSVSAGPRTRLPDIRIVSLKSARAAAVEGHEVLGPLKRAMELTQAGRLEEAEVAYKEVLAADPSVIEARYNLGTIYLGRKDYDAAEGEFQKLIELSPDTVEAYPALSRVYAEQGDNERALEVMARGVALEPDDAGMQLNLGVLYYNARRMEEAEKTLLEVEALDPENVQIQFMLGNLALNRSDLEGAAARFEKYLAEAPGNAPYRETAKDLLEQIRTASSPES